MAKSRRRRWIWLMTIALLLLGGWLVVRAWLQPERLSAFLLNQASNATGLQFTLATPADVGFWPDLHLELDGLTAFDPSAESALLWCDRVEIVVPWSALRGETIQLRSLRLQSPVLVVEELSRWLESRNQDGPPAPFRLPRIDAAVEVASGRIQGKDWTLAELDLALPYLHIGEPLKLEATGSLETEPTEATPFAIDLGVTPKQDGDELRLESITLDLRSAKESAAWVRVEGLVALPPSDALRVDLIATLPQWPTEWPALPLPDADASSEVRIDIDYAGRMNLQGDLALGVSRGDADLRGRLALGDVLAWLEDPAANLLPPLRGEIASDRLDAGGVELRGVRIRFEDASRAADVDGD